MKKLPIDLDTTDEESDAAPALPRPSTSRVPASVKKPAPPSSSEEEESSEDALFQEESEVGRAKLQPPEPKAAAPSDKVKPSTKQASPASAKARTVAAAKKRIREDIQDSSTSEDDSSEEEKYQSPSQSNRLECRSGLNPCFRPACESAKWK
jgi:hypothetical protein